MSLEAANPTARERLERYIQRDHAQVPGMLQTGSISVIWSLIEAQDDLNVRGDVAEIGVFYGKLLILLSLALKTGERAHAFDIFTFLEKAPEENRATVVANLVRSGVSPATVSVHTRDTRTLNARDFVDLIGGRTVRLFSIDGDHSREAVQHDLEIAAAATHSDGILVADDIFNAWCPEVTDGIIDFARSGGGGFRPFALAAANGPLATGCAKLFFAYQERAETYKRYLRALNAPNLVAPTRFLGAEILVFDFPNGVMKSALNDGSREAIRRLSGASR